MQEQHNSFFTGRGHILNEIASFFADDHLKRSLPICRQRGISKTQIAIEYVYRHQQQYQTVIWLNASPGDALLGEVGVFADQHLHLSKEACRNEPQLFATVNDWLQQQEHWLLILDQIEDLSLAEKIVPIQRKLSAHVLRTTQPQVFDTFIQTLVVQHINMQESTLFFLRQAPADVVLDAGLIVQRLCESATMVRAREDRKHGEG